MSVCIGHWLRRRRSPRAATLLGQQRRFDHFRHEYNEERSHQSLGRRTPAELYRSSAREYPGRLPPIEYPSHYVVRRIRHNGEMRWQGQLIYVSQTLTGGPIGLDQLDETRWRVRYGMLPLGTLDTRAARGPRIEPCTSTLVKPTESTKCYRCARSNLLPVYPVAQVRGQRADRVLCDARGQWAM